MRVVRVLARVCLCLLIGAGSVGAGAPLSLSVSPVLMPAPGFVSVRAIVEASDDNRALEIVAESPEYVRSSRIQLDGRAAPHLAVFDFRNLPPGLYDVTGVLIGVDGKRAAVRRVVQVVPSLGSRHR